jgi:hypothetical protein
VFIVSQKKKKKPKKTKEKKRKEKEKTLCFRVQIFHHDTAARIMF